MNKISLCKSPAAIDRCVAGPSWLSRSPEVRPGFPAVVVSRLIRKHGDAWKPSLNKVTRALQSTPPRASAGLIARWITLLSLTCVTVVLAGCGGGGGGAGGAAADTPAGAAATAITLQPTDEAIVVGGPVRFSVVVSGSNVSIQWQVSRDSGITWNDIAGATGATYLISAATSDLSGNKYRAVVTGGAGNVVSSAVTLGLSTAVVAPTITVDVPAISVTAGGDALFTVTVGGTSVTYRWQSSLDGVSWQDVPGATESTLRIVGVQASDAGKRYRVIATNSAGTVTSSTATLSVTAAASVPVLSGQPVAVAVTAPNAAVFSAAASGTPSPSFQWQRSADAGTSFSNIAGATSATYTFSPTSLADSGAYFRLAVSNSAGTVFSAGARLTVTAAPVTSTSPSVTTQPQAVTVTAPGTASFSVAGSGTPPPTVQWQRASAGSAFANIAGATSSSYTLTSTTVADSGSSLRAVLTNSAGTTISDAALLTVKPAQGVAPVINRHPSSLYVLTPYTGTFSVGASGSPSPTVQWQIGSDDGRTYTNIVGATSTSYTTPATLPENAGTYRYRAIVSNTVGSAASDPAEMTLIDSGVGGWVFGVAIDPAGSAYASIMPSGTGTQLIDTRATFYGIKKVSPSGTVSALAGSATEGYLDGTGAAAQFYSPFGIAADAGGNVYVADWGVNRIRKVSPTGVVTTLAGGGFFGGFVDGVGVQASFNQPMSVAVDASGNVYVSDYRNHAIRKITPAGVVTTLAGGVIGNVDGVGAAAKFTYPTGIACDAAGNVYVTDASTIRKITAAGVVTTLATSATPGIFSNADGAKQLGSLGIDAAGNLYIYVEDGYAYAAIRKLAGGVVTNVAGAERPGAQSFSFGVAPDGTIYVGATDFSSATHPYRIRKISPAGAVSYLPR